MKLTIKLDEINYGDVAVRLMPALGKREMVFSIGVGKLLNAIAALPENLIRDIFDAIPAEQKNEIVSFFVVENKSKILWTIDEMLYKNRIAIKLVDYTMDQDLTLTAEIGDINYDRIVERFLPLIREKLMIRATMNPMMIMLLPVIQNASANQIVRLMNQVVGNKDDFLASLVNQNQKNLIAAVEDAAQKQNIRLKINSIILGA